MRNGRKYVVTLIYLSYKYLPEVVDNVYSNKGKLSNDKLKVDIDTAVDNEKIYVPRLLYDNKV